MGRRRGFTLIEAMIVIAILLILAYLLVTSGVAVRAQAHRVGCVSNLRQIGTAFQMYAQDHDERLPPGAYPVAWEAPRELWDRSWHDVLSPYVSEDAGVFFCPAVNRDLGYRFSYGANPYACAYLRGGSAVVDRPRQFVLVAEHATGDWPFVPWPGPDHPTAYLSGRHRGSCGILHFDGSVEMVRPERLAPVAVPVR